MTNCSASAAGASGEKCRGNAAALTLVLGVSNAHALRAETSESVVKAAFEVALYSVKLGIEVSEREADEQPDMHCLSPQPRLI